MQDCLTMKRCVMGALAALCALVAAGAAVGAETAVVGPLRIIAGSTVLEVPPSERAVWANAGSGKAVRYAEVWLRARSRASGAGITARLSWPAVLVRRAVAAARAGRTAISIPHAVSSVSLVAPLIRQRFRNDCEAAALSVALRASVSQERLQRELPVAAPLDPRNTSAGMVWGDPEAGFVGNVEGGGYGVYDRPLLSVALRRDRGAENLTGRPFATMLAALRDGRPIIAWVTLGASRPFSWRTPSGTLIRADRAEHAVTLTTWSPRLIGYVDPVDGKLKTAATTDLAARWVALGRRALALSPRAARVMGQR